MFKMTPVEWLVVVLMAALIVVLLVSAMVGWL